MAEPASVVTATPWSAAAAAASAPPKKPLWGRFLPVVGPLLLFVVWDLAVRSGFIKPILLPTPWDTIGTLITGLAGGPLLTDFLVTVKRTLEAFLIAAVVGVPLGVVLGSNEKAYRSVEIPDRFLSLDALLGADSAVPADLRRVRHQQGRDCGIRRVPARRLQQRVRRDQRAQAAGDGGESNGGVALADLPRRIGLGVAAADLRRPAKRDSRCRS
jgi:hypothetical protein